MRSKSNPNFIYSERSPKSKMPVKDRITGWFIKNIVIPRMEVIDNPGYIILRFTEKGRETYLRELFFPESIIVELERNVVDKYGNEGERTLYSAGKKFGYRYTLISRYPNINEVSMERINKFIYYFLKYMESTYAHKLDYDIDLAEREYTMVMDSYIVCEKNGIGLIMSSGGSAGVWSYMMNDPYIEGVQIDCQGRGDDKCKIICAPMDYLKRQNIRFFKEPCLDNLELSKDYRKINEIRPTKYAKLSLKNLIDNKFFEFSEGIVKRGKERYFLCEASLIYLLESEIKSNLGSSKILFDTSFDFGVKVSEMETNQDFNKFLTDYVSALGWGDISLLRKGGKYSVVSRFFPWTKYSQDSDLIIFSAFMSGLLSGFLNKDIRLNKVNKNLVGSSFTVIASE